MTVWLTEACGTFQNLLALLSVTVMCITDRTGSKQTTKLAMTSATIYVVLYVLGLQLVSAVPSTVVYSTYGVLNGNRMYESATQSAPSVNDSSSSETSTTKAQETMTADSHDVHSSTTIGSGSLNGTSEDDTGNGTQATTPMSQETKEAPHTTPSKPQTTHPHGIRSSTASTSSTTTAGSTTSTSTATGGYIILVILALAIVLLIIVIYCLREKSRSYSFDLHHKTEDANIPLNTVDQEGSFQPTSMKEDKPPSAQSVQEENVTNKDPTSVGNGSTTEMKPTTENGDGDVEKAPSESSFGSQCPLTPKEEPGTFTLDLKDIDLNCSNRTSLESLGEQPNENNNNTTTGETSGQDSATANPNEDFIEVNLDETA
ncbi:hypothetical protein AGOR_G00233690 [Albula goreensis]|uniref:Uncharacterized protein n=1 Tax=Albula goreensis TaxID=1534307 RepID=A0A8T3CKL1_9TELE|nr:hypothetical protein AGOR_G00233690 [Albula goreensis]